MIPGILSGEVLQWYIICALADSLLFIIFPHYKCHVNKKQLMYGCHVLVWTCNVWLMYGPVVYGNY
jgi:hypothetical protein